MELDALQKHLEDITATGASLVAISPQTAEKNVEVKRKNRLAFPVLADADNGYAKQLGLAHKLPKDLRALYQQFGILLPEAHGTSSWELPMPARIVVDRDGTVRDIAADPDYTRRPEPDATLDVLRSL